MGANQYRTQTLLVSVECGLRQRQRRKIFKFGVLALGGTASVSGFHLWAISLASGVYPLLTSQSPRIAAQIQWLPGHHYKPIRRENRRVSTGCGRRRRTSPNTPNGICKSGTADRIEPHHKQSHVIWLIFTTLFQELLAGSVWGGPTERKRSALKVQQTDPSVPFLNYNSLLLFIFILSSIILFTPGSVSHGGEGILTQ